MPKGRKSEYIGRTDLSQRGQVIAEGKNPLRISKRKSPPKMLAVTRRASFRS